MVEDPNTMTFADPTTPIYTVSLLTKEIKDILEGTYPAIYIRGEVSNFKQHISGHRYFILKDTEAQIFCVMWRTRKLSFELSDGMEVIIEGRLTVYAKQGNYQVDCFRIYPAGKGDLYLAFEQLKKKLESLGYFAEERKRKLPEFPHRIGIVTSISGAAIRDILSTLKKRMPLASVLIRPTLVQGEQAPEDIAQAIEELNQTDCDVIILARGGGSIEDLWAFNTEIVANAIFHSKIPIISAVGHEVDFTIADFVADRRAATPTAAAQIVVKDYRELARFLELKKQQLHHHFLNQLRMRKQRITHLLSLLRAKSPLSFLRTQSQYIDALSSQLSAAVNRRLQQNKLTIERLSAHLRSLHPFAPLKKGYALLKSDNHYIGPNEQLQPEQILTLIRHKDELEICIKKIQDRIQEDVENENI